MTLPFMKKKEAAAIGDDDSPVEKDVLDMIADDLMDALQSKNREYVKAAIDALCEYLKDEIHNYEE